MLKRLWRRFAPNPLDALLARARERRQRRFLIAWNRGLGDIALGLYALVYRIREYIPDAQITFLTRQDLKDGFALLKEVDVLVAKGWKRGFPFHLKKTLQELHLSPECFDIILEHPDPTYWLKWQLGTLVPRLAWNPAWDKLWEAFPLEEEKHYVGVHVQTETQYQTNKNWPLAYWEELFKRITGKTNIHIVLFGFQNKPVFENVIDLRGKTDLLQMLSIIKNRCRYLVVPDSGVLSLTYCIEAAFPLKIVSLWADPYQGILKQSVSSPNPKLIHVPLIGKDRDLSHVSVDAVLGALI